MTVIYGIEKRIDGMDFDNYAADPKIIDLCKQWCKSFHSGESVLITGGVGAGKTHLAVAMLKSLADINLKNPVKKLVNENGNLHYEDTYTAEPKAKFITCSDFIMQVMNSIDVKSPVMPVINSLSYPKIDCCCFDDFGTVKLTDYNRNILYVLVNGWYMSMFPVIITTNLSRKDLFEYDARIASRLMEMCTLKIMLKSTDHRIDKKVDKDNI